ncbi:MAG: hypothetical protein DRN27_08010 [Thermoplasmata archaeon]|nr:MAG: hypothetical protein DRN27_08010 [Thermoplasmata archaeon]
MKRMREGKFIANESKEPKIEKDLNVRDMLKITRSINEAIFNERENKETSSEQSVEEEKFKSIFERDKMGVSVKFRDLEIYDDYIFWGGTINGAIQFTFEVTHDNDNTKVLFNYIEGFSPDNPENEEITTRISNYFETFKKYYRDEVLSTDSATEDEKGI